MDAFNASVTEFEQGPWASHYKSLMSLLPLESRPVGVAKQEEFEWVEPIIGLQIRDASRNLSVMPPGTETKASLPFQNNHLESMISLFVYSTPGNDAVVYKNRANRLFQIALAREQEVVIRDTNIKKKCAIPLKDASTPFCLACAYLDLATYLRFTRGGAGAISPGPHQEAIEHMLDRHKEYLSNYFQAFNRPVFNDAGHTICPVTGHELAEEDWCVDKNHPLDTDVQMGHVRPRSDEMCSITGLNVVPMIRRGNMILGERVLIEDVWVNELRGIVVRF